MTKQTTQIMKVMMKTTPRRKHKRIPILPTQGGGWGLWPIVVPIGICLLLLLLLLYARLFSHPGATVEQEPQTRHIFLVLLDIELSNTPMFGGGGGGGGYTPYVDNDDDEAAMAFAIAC